ncbi:DnaJ domain-containing protein, partial [Streptomyces fagopyri]
MARDYYDVLGVARTASPEEIQQAFRTLARKHHPDVNKDPGAEERFKELNDAYSVLSDPGTRQRYDRFGDDFRQIPEDYDERVAAAAGARGGGRGGRAGGGGGRGRGAAGAGFVGAGVHYEVLLWGV